MTDLTKATPTIAEFNSGTNVLNIANNFTQITVNMEIWADAGEGDLVELLFDGQPHAPSQNVIQDAPLVYHINPFTLTKTELAKGAHTIQYKTTTKASIGTPYPTVGYSQVLDFTVIDDINSKDLAIDINEGAAYFTSDDDHLVPANIALIKGPPGSKWYAYGEGRVGIYEANGANGIAFDIDPDGFCPITLIWVKKLPGQATRTDTTTQDALHITKFGDPTILLRKEVRFDDFRPVLDPKNTNGSFISYSANSTAITRDDSPAIISIKVSSGIKSINAQYPSTWSIKNKFLGVITDNDTPIKNNAVSAIRHMSEDIIVKNNTVEFVMSSSTPTLDKNNPDTIDIITKDSSDIFTIPIIFKEFGK